MKGMEAFAVPGGYTVNLRAMFWTSLTWNGTVSKMPSRHRQVGKRTLVMGRPLNTSKLVIKEHLP